MKSILNLFIFIVLIIPLVNSCNSVEPPSGLEINLKLEDVSCTEAWINLSSNLKLPATIELKQNSQVVKTINLSKSDSLLYIDSLLPNTNYQYQASSIQYRVTSNQIQLTTMDATSHNFTFETFTFGGTGGSSTLYDCAIISPQNIWCVGEINIADTSINGYTTYNAVHWDGNEWELVRIMTNACGGVVYPPIQTIFAFAADDILFAHIDGSITHYNGIEFINDCSLITQLNGSANRIWGVSKNDFYVVSGNGFIAHYNGQSWQRIESVTTMGLADIYGNENGDIYACGGNLSTGQGIVLKINSNNTVTKIIDSYYYGSGFDSTKMFIENLYGPLMGIWVAGNGTVYTVGNLIYRHNKDMWNYAKGIEYNYLGAGEFTGRGFSWDVGGKENNDFFFVGQRNTIRHFNGITAVQLGEPFSYGSDYSWLAVDYKQNIAVAAGRKGGYAAVIVFK
jgi:hypothetical protein